MRTTLQFPFISQTGTRPSLKTSQLPGFCLQLRGARWVVCCCLQPAPYMDTPKILQSLCKYPADSANTASDGSQLGTCPSFKDTSNTHKEKNAVLTIQMCLKTRPLMLPYDKVTLHTALLFLRFRVFSPVAFHCFAEKKFHLLV